MKRLAIIILAIMFAISLHADEPPSYVIYCGSLAGKGMAVFEVNGQKYAAPIVCGREA